MTKQAKILIGVGLLVLTLVLGFFAYRAQAKYNQAIGRTVSVASGQTGPITDNTLVQVQLFGPQRREEDAAKNNRNMLVVVTVLAGVGAVLFIILGIASKGAVPQPGKEG